MGVPDPEMLGDLLSSRKLSEWEAYFRVKAQREKDAIERMKQETAR